MRTRIVLTLAIGMSSVAFSACGGPPANPVGGNANTNAMRPNTNNPLDTVKKPVEEVKNNAPTLSPLFKSYCEAWSKNDEAGLRKIYSQDTLKFFESQMKLDKIKSLIKYLEEDKVTGNLCEVINEKIEGDRAVARIRFDKYPNGIPVVFLKENGEWKMTNQSPDLDLKKVANANAVQ